MENLISAILDGDRDRAIDCSRQLIQQGTAPGAIISDGIEKAMKRLDLKCTAEQYNLLEIMLSGRAVMGVIDDLFPAGTAPPERKETIVLCSIQGDVHDLGKNIVKIILTASGYRVVDLGKDCPPDLLIETAVKEKADAVGISSLITYVIPAVQLIKKRLREAGLENIRVLAGGAALKQATKTELNIDYLAETAFDGLHFLEQTGNHECC